jgi:large subunit ribosomal protein L25
MAVSFELNAEPRNNTGKGASRRLRHAGRVPAILYGGKVQPQALTLDHNEVLRSLDHEAFYSHILTVNIGGTGTHAVLRDLQRHPSKPYILHVDLQRVTATEKLRMHVPLHFLGEDIAPGVKLGGGMVMHELIEVEVECLPQDLPEYLEVDVSGLEVGDALHLSDLKVPPGLTLTDLARGADHDLAVVSIHARRAGGEEEETVAAPAAEGAPPAEGPSTAKP